MKNILFKIIPSFIAFTLVGCTGGVTIKDTAGYKVTFKRENVRCLDKGEDVHYPNRGEWPGTYIHVSDKERQCYASGVVKDLAGKKYAQRYESTCHVIYPELIKTETAPACLAANKLDLF